MEDDHKWDDLFNEEFGEDAFETPAKREYARRMFNLMMNNAKTNFELSPDLEGEDDIKNLTRKLYPTEKEISKIIKLYNLSISNIEVERIQNEIIVTEKWMSEKQDHTMDQKYLLNKKIFKAKDIDTQHWIIETLIESDLLGDIEQRRFLERLSIEDQEKYYSILLEKAIEIENYEEAAILRDKINNLS